MFRRTVSADTETNVDAEIARLRSAAEAAGLSPADVALLSAGAAATLADFVARGRQMVGAGTTLSVERTLKGDGYEVRLTFGAGGRKNFLDKIVSAFRRH